MINSYRDINWSINAKQHRERDIFGYFFFYKR